MTWGRSDRSGSRSWRSSTPRAPADRRRRCFCGLLKGFVAGRRQAQEASTDCVMERQAGSRDTGGGEGSDEGPIKGHQELNPRNGESAETIVVGDEEIDPGLPRRGGGARIRRPDATREADLRVSPGRVAVERNQASGAGEHVLVTLTQGGVALLDWFHQHLAEREGRSAQLIVALQHALLRRATWSDCDPVPPADR